MLNLRPFEAKDAKYILSWKNDRMKTKGDGYMKQENDEKINSDKELEFAIFCIENVALELGVPAEKVYDALTSQGDLLHHYIIPEYEMLHTQSKEYIVADIMEAMKEMEVEI